MTAQLPLALLAPDAVEIGPAAALVEDSEGGRVLLHGELAYTWRAGDDASRRLAAAQLADLKAGPVAGIAAAFGVEAATLWRWRRQREDTGVAGLVSDKRGPKGSRILTGGVVAEIARRRAAGQSLRTIGAAVGISASSVGRALEPEAAGGVRAAEDKPGPLPVLAAPADRQAERTAARAGLIDHAEPVFVPAARVPLAGLFLALPALQATGLLACAKTVFGSLPAGFYGLDTMLLEAVFRTLAGEPRAEGSTRIDPAALGRVLGMDRAPEVKTIRRKLTALAGTGNAPDLLRALAAEHLAHGKEQDLAALLYVDGHVRAYQGTRKIAKNHSTRLKFPAPATVETRVADANGDPVLVVMAEPGAALTTELRRLLPQLRQIIGDDRRVLVGFDRGGWSPALFAHMASAGFDVLTWRKGTAEDIDESLFAPVEYTDATGRTHAWQAADTMVELPVGDRADGEVFAVRQITRRVDNGKGAARQIHVLTTVTGMDAGDVIYRMGSRWRQENYFRYARMHFDLDAHDSYAVTEDDPERSVPNPAKKHAYAQVTAARTRYDQAVASTDAALLAARTPAPGRETVLITNEAHNAITAPLLAAETALEEATAAHRAIPTRVRLGDIAPGQLVLDIETKQLTHAIRIAAFNTVTALARDLRINTGYARAADEAHTLIRQALTHSGDIHPTGDGQMTIRLDPMPTPRATKAIADLCEHLTTTRTRYPGTGLTLRYEIKNQP